VAAAGGDVAAFLLELGVLAATLGVLARGAAALRLSPIPLYLLAGVAFGDGGLVSLGFSRDFVDAGADIGVLLLLFMLGLEYTADDLRVTLRRSAPAGAVDAALNFTPGLLAGLLLGWSPAAAVLLGGITWGSSSGIIAKLLADLGRIGNRETPVVLGVLVLEDLAMAGFLPLAAVLASGQEPGDGLGALALALAVAAVAMRIALRHGERISRAVAHTSDEVVLLSLLGLVLVVGGLAERLQVSSAVGAFLVGTALSGPVAERARGLVSPLRDVFAAAFFAFFGLQVQLDAIPPVLAAGLALAAASAATKVATGWWAAARERIGPRGRMRAGTALVARGEFSILLAGLGVGLEPELGPLATAYVLVLALAAPLLARAADPLADRLARPPPGRTLPTA
jgi:CPA2 family monovalent cation:H+ antiporter-2